MAAQETAVELADRLGLRLAAELVPGRAPIASGMVAPTSIYPVTEDVAALLPEAGLAGQIAMPAGRLGSTSLLWRLLAGPSRAGRWCAVISGEGLYPLAARAAGVDLERVAFVEAKGPEQITAALGAVCEGVPVVVASTRALNARQMQRAAARARRSGTVLIWREAAPVTGVDVRLEPVEVEWVGLRANEDRCWGSGRLAACRIAVTATWRSRGSDIEAEVWPYGRQDEHEPTTGVVVPFARARAPERT